MIKSLFLIFSIDNRRIVILALLGASPGASTAPPIMIKVLQMAFKDRLGTPQWQAKMLEMVPSYGQKLNSDSALANKIRHYSSDILGLKAFTLDVPPN